MTAIPGATHTSRMLVDGTLAITVMVEPRHAQDAFRLLCVPGTAVAIAALKDKPGPYTSADVKQPKGGDRAKWISMRCQELEFQTWLENHHPHYWRANAISKQAGQMNAASTVRALCSIDSRAELDNDPIAAERFERLIRKPWAEHNGFGGVTA